MIDTIYGGGTETQFAMLLENIDRGRFEVFVVTLRATPWLTELCARLGIPLSCFELMRLKRPGTPARLLALWRHLRRVRPQVAMTFFPLSNLLGVPVARAAGVRRVYSTRRDYGLWPGCVFRGDLRLLRLVDRLAAGIVVNAAVIRDLVRDLERCDPAKITVVYNGVVPRPPAGAEERAQARAALGIPADAPVIGLVAGLRPMKRHETFLEAARTVLARRPDARFLLVGDGPRRAELEALAGSLGVSGSVHFAGWRDDVAPLVAALDVGVNCSANEGLSNAVMEYMAAGVPCVASAAGGNPELVEDGVNGLLFPLGDAGRLAALLLRLLEDRELGARLAGRSRALIEQRFSPRAMAAAYEGLFS